MTSEPRGPSLQSVQLLKPGPSRRSIACATCEQPEHLSWGCRFLQGYCFLGSRLGSSTHKLAGSSTFPAILHGITGVREFAHFFIRRTFKASICLLDGHANTVIAPSWTSTPLQSLQHLSRPCILCRRSCEQHAVSTGLPLMGFPGQGCFSLPPVLSIASCPSSHRLE